MNPDTLNQWRGNLGLSEVAMARYLGVPINTVRNWFHGRRKPDAATIRLFDILQLIQRDAPLVHADLIRAAQDDAPMAPAKRRRTDRQPAEPQVAATPADAPESVPDWLKTSIG